MFRAKHGSEIVSKEAEERLEKVEERLQVKFVVSHKQRRRRVAETLRYAKTHTMS